MTALIEVKTSDLAGEALNWVVGAAEGLNMYVASTVYGVPARAFVHRLRGETVYGQRYDPANDWATTGSLMGQIIELKERPNEDPEASWKADTWRFWAAGSTQQIAICRAIARQLGETVSVPAELMP